MGFLLFVGTFGTQGGRGSFIPVLFIQSTVNACDLQQRFALNALKIPSIFISFCAILSSFSEQHQLFQNVIQLKTKQSSPICRFERGH